MIWLLGIIALLILVGFYPIRIWLEGSVEEKIQAKVFWQPLPFFKRRVCIARLPKEKVEKAVKQEERLTREAESEIAQAETEEAGGKREEEHIPPGRQRLKDKLRSLFLAKQDLKDLMLRSLGCLRIEVLELDANLAGNAAYSAFGGGLLWSALGFGLGVLSTKVKRYPRHPQIHIGLNPFRPWQAHFRFCGMLRVGNGFKIGFYGLKLLWKNRQWLKEQRSQQKTVREYQQANA